MTISKKVKYYILGGVALALIIWDIVLATNTMPRDTISMMIFDLARKHPMVPFFFGILCGHFFWGIKK